MQMLIVKKTINFIFIDKLVEIYYYIFRVFSFIILIYFFGEDNENFKC